MDREETKSKLLKVITVLLPILLVGILALTIVMAMNMSRDDSQPVLSTDVSEQGSNTSEGEEDEPGEEDTPVEDFFSEGLLFESLGNGTCVLTGKGECEDSYIVVPSESPNGDSVVKVGDSAFKGCTTIKGIELPETVREIGDYAFYGSSIIEIAIGARIEQIGSYAFSGCKKLTGINVEASNSEYSSVNGVLYNKNGNVLITYPAGKNDNFCVISGDVEEILTMAFFKCSSIKKVTYYGTEAQWSYIEIGAGNDVIDEAILFCAGSVAK